MCDYETPDTTGLREAGLQHRYNVEKVNDPTGKHAECRYFVLDPKHDPLARAAIRAYADAARQSPELVALADDLDNLLAAHPTPDASPDPAVVTPDGEVRRTARVLADMSATIRDYFAAETALPVQSFHATALAHRLANHVAAAREADRAEVTDEFLLREATKYHDLWRSAEERLAGLVAKIEALADEWEAAPVQTPSVALANVLRALIPADAAKKGD